jgi:hypothetical protein
MLGTLERPAGAQGLTVPAALPDLKPGVVTLHEPPIERRAPSSNHPAPQGHKDSLWNGALAGAGVGAIAGVLTGDAIVECSECAGFNVALTFGVLGAGAGAAIGAGIDAARHDRTTSWTPGRSRRVAVAPVIGKRARALIASVRF